MDEPLLYESWGKKQTYILAFTPTEVVDVTEHYTRRVVFGLLLWCKTSCLPHQYAEFFEHGMMADVHDPILQFHVAFFFLFFRAAGYVSSHRSLGRCSRDVVHGTS